MADSDTARIAKLEEGFENHFAFSLNEAEQAEFKAWYAEHDITCSIRDGHTAIGGRFTFCFTKMTIGDKCLVKCACGGEKDVSDYGHW
ncbi:MAG: hypothetical protein JWM39_29 [Parcubacteria group bacterium]|nr:hypothetical protein [Parcubacteria group bacterium]